ncbi:unnamed protein product [Brassica oleracea var. botrytis]
MFSGLGSYSLWSVGIVLSCFLGLAIGFATRPYIIRHVSFFILTIIITFVYVSNSLNQIIRKFDGISPFLHVSTVNPTIHVLITFDDAQETNNDEECSDQETDIALTLPRATIHDMINVQIQRWLRTALQLFLC